MRRALRKKVTGVRLKAGRDVKTPGDLIEFWLHQKAFNSKPAKPVSPRAAMDALRRSLNVNTRAAHMDLNVDNYSRNSPRLKVGRGIREIDGKYAGQAAIIVGAGPSLDKNGRKLRNAVGRIPIFACDAALPMLHAMGVEPDYVMVIDTKATQAKFFSKVRRKTRTKLLAIACAHPETLAAWPGETLFFNSFGDAPDEKIQMDSGQDFGSIGVGGNVSTGLFWLASVFCEATTIVLVGHDFSYDYKANYYAKDGVHALAATKKQTMPTWGVYGGTVLTDMSLWAYKGFTEDYATDLVGFAACPHGDVRVRMDGETEAPVCAQHGVPLRRYRIINATEGGILGTTEVRGVLLPSIEQRRLADVLAELASDVPVGPGASIAPTYRDELRTGVAPAMNRALRA